MTDQAPAGAADPVDARPASGWRSLLTGLAAAVERREAAGADQTRCRQALAVLTAEIEHRDGSAADERLAAVTERFALPPSTAALLRVAVAVEIDPTVHLLCGLLAGDDRAGRPTVAVAAELCGLDLVTDPGVTAGIGPESAAHRWGVLLAEGDVPVPARRLRAASAVVAEVRGVRRRAAETALLADPPVTVGGAAADRIARALSAGHPLVWVHSPAGTAGTAAALAACEQLGIAALPVDVRRSPLLDDEGAPAAARSLVLRLLVEAALDGAVLVVAGAELLAAARDLLELAPLPVVAVATAPWPRTGSAALPVTVTAPRPTPEDRARIWWPLLGGHDPDPVVASLRLTPDEIVRVARHARAQAALAGEELSTDHVLASSRALSSNRLDAPDRSRMTLDDLVLPSLVRGELTRLLDWARLRDRVRRPGDRKATGVSALFSGSPGTGKTLAANVVADALGMDLQQVELAAVVSKYIGETEKNLERVFAQAEATHAVLFFDEADALFGSRSEVKDARDRYANQEIAYLLQRMEQFDGVTVLATNLRGNLDPAFSRRLQFILHFPDPDEPTRRRLWERHLVDRDLDPTDPPDLDVLAREVELAGGDIRNIVLAAAVDAMAAGRPLSRSLLAVAVDREYAKLGRRAPGLPRS